MDLKDTPNRLGAKAKLGSIEETAYDVVENTTVPNILFASGWVVKGKVQLRWDRFGEMMEPS